MHIQSRTPYTFTARADPLHAWITSPPEFADRLPIQELRAFYPGAFDCCCDPDRSLSTSVGDDGRRVDNVDLPIRVVVHEVRSSTGELCGGTHDGVIVQNDAKFGGEMAA
jgi:hypothetical protein